MFRQFLLLAVVVWGSLIGDQPHYFSNPKLCSSEELAQELKGKTLDMSWHFGKESHFRFVTGHEEVYFELQLENLPETYNDFVARVKPQCLEREKRLIFSYKIQKGGKEEINQPQDSIKDDPDTYTYIVTDRRKFEKANPQRLDLDQLRAIIRDKNVLFYTGAGLSLASDIPAMNELMELLGLEEGEAFVFSLEKALQNPKEFASKIQKFHRACFFSTPTLAHHALKELAVFKNVQIITENLDCLHEASGICPYRVQPNHLRDEVGGSALKSFEYIICVGLSFDDKGFLGWYKQQNPHGKIIAIDLKQPSYLGDEDLLITGDIQEIVPAIQEIIPQ